MERRVEDIAGRMTSGVSWGETRDRGKIQRKSQKESQRVRRVEIAGETKRKRRKKRYIGERETERKRKNEIHVGRVTEGAIQNVEDMDTEGGGGKIGSKMQC